ncbi:MAG TPA: hypothetical protein VGN84_03750 [Solirubrobacterales bacterium]|nr:hypothetical protein [Solirubrobacterales bacterium]
MAIDTATADAEAKIQASRADRRLHRPVVIVDADGRLDADAPRFAAARFESDPAVGGVRSLVRIYNRRHFLTWLQDLEFSVYGYLFQAGRDDGHGRDGRQRSVQPAQRSRRHR